MFSGTMSDLFTHTLLSWVAQGLIQNKTKNETLLLWDLSDFPHLVIRAA